MAKIDWKAINTKLGKRCETYALKVRSIMDKRIGEIVAMCEGLELQDGKPFAFADYPEISKQVQATFRLMYSEIYQSIRGNITQEWYYSNADMDGLLAGLFGKGALEDKHFARYFGRNKEAMNQFFARKEAGMNLSQRVWAITGNTKADMEVAIDLSLGQGVDAGELSRKVRQYLQEPDMLFRRFRYREQEPVLDDKGKPVLDKNGKPVMQGKVDKDGKPVYGRKWKRRHYDKATDSFYWVDDNPHNYHTGRGVYRSSYKNAMRLARTETNMAYRAADCERWKEMEFVRGFRVVLSKNHPCDDICNDLSAADENDTSGRGEYPKGFVFKGWHPHCYCYCVPLLCTEDELFQLTDQILRGEDTSGFVPAGVIEQPNEHFMQWVENNKDKISDQIADPQRGWGSLPYFLQDNYSKASGKGNWVQDIKNEAGQRGTHTATTKPQPATNAAQTTIVDSDSIISTMPADIDKYDRSIPTDPSGAVDIAEYRKKIAELLQSAGCYTGTNVTTLASFTTKAQLDNWYTQSLKIANIDALDKITDKVNKLLASGKLKGQPFEVVKQAHDFLTQYYEYMRKGEYVKATNALRGFTNLHDLIAAKVDFSKVSMLMPKELLESGSWFNGTASSIDKAFFDLLTDYVPVKIGTGKKGNTWFKPAEGIVELWSGDSRFGSSWYKHKTIYHEFGHALDHQHGLCRNRRIVDLWNKFETAMQSKSTFAVYEGGHMVQRNMTLFEYAHKMLPYYRDSMALGKAKTSVLTRLGIVQADVISQATAFADTINSLSKGKYCYGHSAKYWRSSADSVIKEFIAHAFENQYAGNGFFRWMYKDLFDEMVKVLGMCL